MVSSRKGPLQARIGFVVGLLFIGTGCWQQAEREMETRVDGMDGHLMQLFDAAEATAAGDDKQYKKAMKGLAKAESLPGVDDAQLDAVRTLARSAAAADTRALRAAAVPTVAMSCASCHTQLGGDAPSLHGIEGGPATVAVAALVWQDDALWTRAASAAHDAGLDWPADTSWPQRAPLVTQLLSR